MTKTKEKRAEEPLSFITLTAFVDGHSVAVRLDAVRVVEDEMVDDKPAARVTLTDGTQFLVRGDVCAILTQLEKR
jgi:hypothetical protein